MTVKHRRKGDIYLLCLGHSFLLLLPLSFLPFSPLAFVEISRLTTIGSEKGEKKTMG